MPYVTLGNGGVDYKLSDLMTKLTDEKKGGYFLQKRKHEDWTDNYDLYRNKVRTNRLTQRQAVNIPLMKETIKTLLSKIDDSPNVDWEESSGDEEKEIVFQEVWNDHLKQNNLELIDLLDKKNVLLYGFSVKKLNIDDYGVCADVLDPYDVLIDPLMKPWDVDSARYIIHQNIFKSIREILADEKYNKEGKDDLKIWADSAPGILQGNMNKLQWEEKMQRLLAMGVQHKDFPYFAGGDMVVNLTEHHTMVWNTELEAFERRVIVYADDKIELYNETLMECLGVDFWPFTRWSEDPETNDVYPDGVADLVRTPNKVLNVWFSQLIENRTLKNFQMHWFMPTQGYAPQTYTPGPGMMLPAPPSLSGRVQDVIQPVDIQGLDDTLTAIQALTSIVEKGSGATAIDKGIIEEGKRTLGEVEIAVGKSGERATAMAKFYRLSWHEYAWKWCELIHANPPKILKLSKKGRSGKVYYKNVYRKDWLSSDGYKPVVRSTSEQESEKTKAIQKFMFVMQQFPDNSALRKIAQKRELELLDLTSDELKQIEDAEDQAVQQRASQTSQSQMDTQMQAATTEAPNPALVKQLQDQMAQLNA